MYYSDSIFIICLLAIFLNTWFKPRKNRRDFKFVYTMQKEFLKNFKKYKEVQFSQIMYGEVILNFTKAVDLNVSKVMFASFAVLVVIDSMV